MAVLGGYEQGRNTSFDKSSSAGVNGDSLNRGNYEQRCTYSTNRNRTRPSCKGDIGENMKGVRSHVEKMINLVSDNERRRNPEVERTLYKIKCLLLWLNETIHAEPDNKKLQRREENGQ